jgi:hippurate hydrolase
MSRRLAVCLPAALVLLVVPSDAAGAPPPADLAALRKAVADDYPYLDALYKHFHRHPELSLQEELTAARLAKELRAAGFAVTEKVGGYGVVGVLANGKGPTVMIRADMDGLPVVENTGLPYASKARARDAEGQDVGVMHACGHDVNMTCLIGVARRLAALKGRWAGTLVLVGQPAEEIGQGARLMLDAGLFKRFPRPDHGLALHCDGRYPAGTVTYREGQMQAHVDSVEVVMKGKGGHGAAPHLTIDPVVLAARVVLDLQTLVSRERNPLDPAVVTVGSIHGGTRPNIIPNEVRLQITVRTTNDATRKEVLDGIARVAKSAAAGARAPDPVIKHDAAAFTPALVNDPALTRRMVKRFKEVLGPEKVIERPPSMGGEDFSQFVRAGVPGFYYFVGTVPAKPAGRPPGATHSDAYYPDPEPTLTTGVYTMTLAVLDLMGRR